MRRYTGTPKTRATIPRVRQRSDFLVNQCFLSMYACTSICRCIFFNGHHLLALSKRFNSPTGKASSLCMEHRTERQRIVHMHAGVKTTASKQAQLHGGAAAMALTSQNQISSSQAPTWYIKVAFFQRLLAPAQSSDTGRRAADIRQAGATPKHTTTPPPPPGSRSALSTNQTFDLSVSLL